MVVIGARYFGAFVVVSGVIGARYFGGLTVVNLFGGIGGAGGLDCLVVNNFSGDFGGEGGFCVLVVVNSFGGAGGAVGGVGAAVGAAVGLGGDEFVLFDVFLIFHESLTNGLTSGSSSKSFFIAICQRSNQEIPAFTPAKFSGV